MRLVMVVDTFPVVSETFLAEKAVGLLDRGLDVQVVCWRRDDAAWSRIAPLRGRDDLAARVHLWPTRRAPAALLANVGAAARRSVADPVAARRYLSALVRQAGWSAPAKLVTDAYLLRMRPDVLHFEFGAAAAARARVRPLLGRPVTVSLRGYDVSFLGLEDPSFYDGLWPHVDAVHTLGDDLWRRALLRGCPPDMPHVLVPPAVDTGSFTPPDHDPEPDDDDRPLRLLSVGRLHWKKGYEHVLAALARLRDAGVSFEYRVVGEGPHRDAVESCIVGLGLEGATTLLGEQPRGVVRDELAAADVFVHGAVSEGFCNAVLEAQAMQVPVVCTDADGLGENVEHGTTGLVVPRRDATALAAAVASLAADPGRRRALGAAGRRRVIERFGRERQLDALVAFYAEVVARDRSATTGAPDGSGTLTSRAFRPRSTR